MTRKDAGAEGIEFPDQTVDFAAEILKTPPAAMGERIRRLSADMRATVLAEVARRFQDLARDKESAERDLENLRYHAQRLETMLLDMAAKGR